MTRTGDAGTTGLWSGERVGKDDLRVEAYGTIDELSAQLAVAKHQLPAERGELLEKIQNDLFKVAGMLATRGGVYVHPLTSDEVGFLEQLIHGLEERVTLHGFCIPGMTPIAAQLDLCRTVARRAERRIIALDRVESVSEPLRCYVNRVSDFLYLLARFEEQCVGKVTPKVW